MPSHTSLLHRLVFVLLTCASSCHAAIGPKTDLKIVNAALSPDGYSARDAVLAGGTSPGPLIVGHQGDIFQINVVNQLTNETMLTSTSVHWHGVLQRGTNWADGGAFVNQCPIVSGESFLYEFNADHPGTFWYHSHLATQYCDGLRGPLVVYDRNDPHAALYDIDDESTVLTLADWYHVAAALETTIPHGDSTLINGMGRWFGNSTAELAVFNVSAGKRYRFRLINMACDPNYTFSIDGHNMTVIEADGENTEPLTVDQLQIFVGQRYSFVLEANQPVDNYWIRAAPNVMTSGGTGFANGINSAILRYSGAPQAEPTTVQSLGVTPLREYDLRPLTDPAAPGQPEVGGGSYSLNLVPGFNSTSHHFTVSNVSYVSPDVPVLLQILAGRDPHKLMPNGSVYNLPLNSVIELSMPALNIGGPHPFHLHGHSFSVVRSAGQTGYNYVNPVRRDVVSIGSGSDNVTIRFVTDNPGPWFLHCHIDWHFQNGLAIVFAEATDLDVAISNPVPPAWWELCPMYNASLQSS